MKDYLTGCTKRWKILSGLLLILMTSLLTTVSAQELNLKHLHCDCQKSSPYLKVIEKVLPSFIVVESDNSPYYSLEVGALVETFDPQAIGALETGIASNWYPHYLATVIIAADRSQTDVKISTWNDLYTAQEAVAFANTHENLQMLIAAMSYGLEGEDYSLSQAIQLMSFLADQGLIKMNSFEAPLIICYDYQAVALMQAGRNIEIIIPEDGTFTYQKGLLSNQDLKFQGNVNELLLESNLPLLDGQSKSNLYPNQAAYQSAVRVTNYQHFAKITQKAGRLIERKVFNSKKYMSIDKFEHLMFALIYIIIITIWIALIIQRSMQSGVSYAAFFTGIILIGWTFVRLIKYQLELSPTLARYLWYGFYLFQLTLPLVLLWMAWAIDKPEDAIMPPKWLKQIALLVGLLVVLVFTNDLHGLVLDLDLSRKDWDINYSYGLAYYVILFVCMTNLIAVFVILIKKSLRNPRRKRMMLPPLFFFLFAIYNYLYIKRDPLIYATDLTIITGLFTMLMFESCMRSGIIPVNTKYIELFQGSPLKMRIFNKEGEIILESGEVIPLAKDMIKKILEKSPQSILQDNDTLLFVDSIPGGYTVWHEDVSQISQLNRDIEKSTRMLAEANAILMEEKKLKQSDEEAQAKKELIEQLESQIATNVEQLIEMIEEAPYKAEESREATRIALLLCYIKRRCSLFFQEKEADHAAVENLVVWLDELSDIAQYSNVKTARINQAEGNIDIRDASLFYDVFYRLVDLAVKKDCSYIIGYLESKEGEFEMGLLLPSSIGQFELEPQLLTAIEAAKGKISIKDIEETKGVTVSLPERGRAYD